jgi:AraC-like DNA-binding protein
LQLDDPPLRETRPIAELPALGLFRVSCEGHAAGWSQEEEIQRFAVILTAEGTFRRRVRGCEHTADPLAAYAQCEGEAQQIAHPRGGDVTTVIVPRGPLLGELGDPDRLRGTTFLIRAEVDLAHRVLLARATAGADADELTERASALVGGLIDALRLPSDSPSRVERRLAAMVREALDVDLSLMLVDLAVESGVSIYRLSRAFRRVMGVTVTGYRLQLRTRHALARLAAGDTDLAGIAVDAGFADQAHFTRTLRAAAGMTPGAFRQIVRDAARIP